jgi:hypothetical protein
MSAANITITDTGKRRVGDSVNELDVVSVSGASTTLTAGSTLTLYSATIQLNISSNTNKQVTPNKKRTQSGDTATQSQQRQFEISEIDVNSINNPNWTIEGSVDISSSTGLITYARLRRLAKTKGHKTIGGHDLITYANYEENGNAVGTILNVRIDSVSFTFVPGTSKNLLKYTIACTETA